MNELITGTGRKIDCCYFVTIPSTRRLTIRVQGLSISDVAIIFSDPAETIRLQVEDQIAEGYTHLSAIIPEGMLIRIALEKE